MLNLLVSVSLTICLVSTSKASALGGITKRRCMATWIAASLWVRGWNERLLIDSLVEVLFLQIWNCGTRTESWEAKLEHCLAFINWNLNNSAIARHCCTSGRDYSQIYTSMLHVCHTGKRKLIGWMRFKWFASRKLQTTVDCEVLNNLSVTFNNPFIRY